MAVGLDVRERLSEADEASTDARADFLKKGQTWRPDTAFLGLPAFLGLFPWKGLLRPFLGEKSRKL